MTRFFSRLHTLLKLLALAYLAGCTPLGDQANVAGPATTDGAKANSQPVNNNATAMQKAPEHDGLAVSTDFFGVPGQESMQGNGHGDVVLQLWDAGDPTPRKKSLLIDLAQRNEHGDVTNDLTASYFVNKPAAFSISHPELDTFISRSKQPELIEWQVFGIFNHLKRGSQPLDATFYNYGLLSTEHQAEEGIVLTFAELHKAKALRAALILDHNEYGIEPNGALVSATGEKTAFDPLLHRTLPNGQQSTAVLNQSAGFFNHKIDTDLSNPDFRSRKARLHRLPAGQFRLYYDAQKGQAQLDFKPR